MLDTLNCRLLPEWQADRETAKATTKRAGGAPDCLINFPVLLDSLSMSTGLTNLVTLMNVSPKQDLNF